MTDALLEVWTADQAGKSPKALMNSRCDELYWK
jgi:protocatechuate 3,4-dioxygenase beta subunit